MFYVETCLTGLSVEVKNIRRCTPNVFKRFDIPILYFATPSSQHMQETKMWLWFCHVQRVRQIPRHSSARRAAARINYRHGKCWSTTPHFLRDLLQSPRPHSRTRFRQCPRHETRAHPSGLRPRHRTQPQWRTLGSSPETAWQDCRSGVPSTSCAGPVVLQRGPPRPCTESLGEPNLVSTVAESRMQLKARSARCNGSPMPRGPEHQSHWCTSGKPSSVLLQTRNSDLLEQYQEK